MFGCSGFKGWRNIHADPWRGGGGQRTRQWRLTPGLGHMDALRCHVKDCWPPPHPPAHPLARHCLRDASWEFTAPDYPTAFGTAFVICPSESGSAQSVNKSNNSEDPYLTVSEEPNLISFKLRFCRNYTDKSLTVVRLVIGTFNQP